jgi:two-component system NtrC family sensor kinase
MSAGAAQTERPSSHATGDDLMSWLPRDRSTWIQLLALIILLGWHFSFFGEVFVSFEVPGRHYSLADLSRAIEDPDGTLTIDDILTSPQQARFPDSQINHQNFGLTESFFWIKVDGEKLSRLTAEAPSREWILEFSRPHLDVADLFIVKRSDTSGAGSVIATSHSGMGIRIEDRQIPYANAAFRFDTSRPDTDVYLRLENRTAFCGNLSLWEPGFYLRKIAVEQALFGIFLGGAITILLYNFCMLISMRSRMYAYFLGYLFFISSLVVIDFGHSLMLFEDPNPYFLKEQIPTIIWCTWIFTFLFTTEVLEYRTLNYRLWLATRLVIACLVVAILCTPFVPFKIRDDSAIFASVGFFPLLFSLGIYAYVKGVREGMYFVSSWFFNISGTAIFSMVAIGLLNPTPLTLAAMPVGVLAEAVMLTFSLADKIKRAQKMVDRENQRTLDLMTRYSHELEDKVRERTKDLENSQQELVIKQQMAAMGVLTAGIAHEINNPNNFVSAGLQNLTAWKESFEQLIDELLSEDSDPGVRDMFRERFGALDTQIAGLSSSSDNISTIVTGLRTITRLDEADMKEVDATDGMLQIMRFLRAGIGKGIDFTSLAPDRPKVLCYPAELNSAFMALMTNAIQAVRDREAATHGPVAGNIHIESHLVEERNTRYLRMHLRDNGIGMSAKTLSKAFEPFFTTRASGEGAGLGLSISRDTIEKHGGKITLNSSPGKGTSVVILLPVAVS